MTKQRVSYNDAAYEARCRAQTSRQDRARAVIRDSRAKRTEAQRRARAERIAAVVAASRTRNAYIHTVGMWPERSFKCDANGDRPAWKEPTPLPGKQGLRPPSPFPRGPRARRYRF